MEGVCSAQEGLDPVQTLDDLEQALIEARGAQYVELRERALALHSTIDLAPGFRRTSSSEMVLSAIRIASPWTPGVCAASHTICFAACHPPCQHE